MGLKTVLLTVIALFVKNVVLAYYSGIFDFINDDSPYLTGYDINGVKSMQLAPEAFVIAIADELPALAQDLFLLYPNPNDGTFTLRFEKEGNKTIMIYNLLGTLVYSLKTEDQFTVLSGLDLSAGQYLVKVVDEYNQQEVKRFIINK